MSGMSACFGLGLGYGTDVLREFMSLRLTTGITDVIDGAATDVYYRDDQLIFEPSDPGVADLIVEHFRKLGGDAAWEMLEGLPTFSVPEYRGKPTTIHLPGSVLDGKTVGSLGYTYADAKGMLEEARRGDSRLTPFVSSLEVMAEAAGFALEWGIIFSISS
jgi:hypothetical protein